MFGAQSIRHNDESNAKTAVRIGVIVNNDVKSLAGESGNRDRNSLTTKSAWKIKRTTLAVLVPDIIYDADVGQPCCESKTCNTKLFQTLIAHSVWSAAAESDRCQLIHQRLSPAVRYTNVGTVVGMR